LRLARDNAFTSSPADSASEDAVLFLAKAQSSQRPVKGEKPPIQKPCKPHRPDKSKFPESEGAAARLHTEEELQARMLGYQLVPLATTV
jgi:hypothetical protein